MTAISPRFTFLATLCALAALSSAPISDAAVLRLRSSDLASTEVTSNYAHSGASTFLSRRSSHVVDVLPLPKGLGGSQKKSAGSGDSLSSSPSGDESHGEKDAPTGHDAEDSTYDDSGVVHKKGGEAKVKDRQWNSFRPMKQLSNRHHRGLRTKRSVLGPGRDLSSTSITSGHDGHVHVRRSPHHRHHHHSGHKNVIVSGDHDHVRVDRSPRSHHHHHHPSGHEKVVVSGDHDHVRVNRSPRSHHHHHHHHHQNEHEKVVVSGDHDHVRVDRSLGWNQGGEIMSGDHNHVYRRRSVLISGEQGQSYVVPRVARRSSAQELFTVPPLPLKKRDGGMDCAPGYIRIMSPSESGGEFLASLVLASTNSTSLDNSTTPSPAFVLNASEMDMTPMCLQASSYNTSDSALTPDEVGVTLLVEMFDATSASIVPYCATFDPDPPAPAPLTAEKCTDDPVSEQQSQLFAFNRATGVVRPMWFKAQDGTDSESNNGCVEGGDQTPPQSSSPPSAAEGDSDRKALAPNADQADQADFAVLAAESPEMAPSDSSEGSTSGAQNVALVFVAKDPVVMDTPGDAGTSLASAPATATGAETSSNASTATVPSTSVMTTASPTMQVPTSSSGSVSASAIPSAGPNTSVSTVVSSGSPTPVPPSTGLVSGAPPAPSMMLGVQVVPESASDVTSTTSASATPTVTPVNTQPYEWMFTLDS